MARAVKDATGSLAGALAAALGLGPSAERPAASQGSFRSSDRFLSIDYSGAPDDPELRAPSGQDELYEPPAPPAETFLPPTSTIPTEPVWTPPSTLPPVPPPAPPRVPLPVIGGIVGPILGVIGGILFPGNTGKRGQGEIYERGKGPAKRPTGSDRSAGSRAVNSAIAAVLGIWQRPAPARVPSTSSRGVAGTKTDPIGGSTGLPGWPGGTPGQIPKRSTGTRPKALPGISTVSQTAEDVMMRQAGLGRAGVGHSDTPKPRLTTINDELLDLVTKPKQPTKPKTEACECEEKKKEKRVRKPRVICQAGSFEQGIFRTRKTNLRVIPCR